MLCLYLKPMELLDVCAFSVNVTAAAGWKGLGDAEWQRALPERRTIHNSDVLRALPPTAGHMYFCAAYRSG